MRRERERTSRNESGAKGPGSRAMTRTIVLNKKLYIGNIPFSCTEADLRDLFGRHGTVTSVNVITDRETGRPRPSVRTPFFFLAAVRGAGRGVRRGARIANAQPARV